jgi:hypothetical protein
MKQSRLMSMVETVGNTAIGFGVAIGAQLLIFPLFGFSPPLSQNFMIAGLFTVVSIVRGYLLRRLFEALHIRVPLSPSMQAIIAERQRQMSVEGFDAAHDDSHLRGELAAAGAMYALTPARRQSAEVDRCVHGHPGPDWPWSREWWKPQDDRRDLVRAGALILAELDRDLRKRRKATS